MKEDQQTDEQTVKLTQDPITLHDKKFTPFISQHKIQSKVRELADKISFDHNNTNPVFIIVLKGAFMFASDLLKNASIPCETEFVRIKSYDGMQTTGEVKEIVGLQRSAKDRHVVIVEDIVDTGTTMNHFINSLNKLHTPRTVQIASLFVKPQLIQYDLQIDYCGFEIGNDFIVGYGLDYNELGRNLPRVYKLKQ